jgi:F0F1-type ATP synthase epsilon subunit
MQFFLSTPEYNKLQSNTTKVKVHLRNGIAEILNQHEDLIGKVESNLVEVESNFENKFERSIFALQEAIFVVSTKGLDTSAEKKETTVYIYARRVKEITPGFSIMEILKQYEEAKNLLEIEGIKLELASTASKKCAISSTISLIKQDISFFKKVISLSKEMK